MRTEWKDGERTREVEVKATAPGKWEVTVDGAVLNLTVEVVEGGRLRLTGDDGTHVAEVTATGSRRFVRVGTMDFVLDRVEGSRKRGGAHGGGGLEAPMPGVVTKVLIAEGDAVKKGQPLLAVEAMKMEHVIRAPRDGRIAALRTRAGEIVSPGAALVELEEAAS
jgi:biotin carboxyl carrier protein